MIDKNNIWLAGMYSANAMTGDSNLPADGYRSLKMPEAAAYVMTAQSDDPEGVYNFWRMIASPAALPFADLTALDQAQWRVFAHVVLSLHNLLTPQNPPRQIVTTPVPVRRGDTIHERHDHGEARILSDDDDDLDEDADQTGRAQITSAGVHLFVPAAFQAAPAVASVRTMPGAAVPVQTEYVRPSDAALMAMSVEERRMYAPSWRDEAAVTSVAPPMDAGAAVSVNVDTSLNGAPVRGTSIVTPAPGRLPAPQQTGKKRKR